MAADQPDVLVAQLLDEIATRFHWLTPILGEIDGCNRKLKIQDGGCQNISYMHASLYNIDNTTAQTYLL